MTHKTKQNHTTIHDPIQKHATIHNITHTIQIHATNEIQKILQPYTIQKHATIHDTIQNMQP